MVRQAVAIGGRDRVDVALQPAALTLPTVAVVGYQTVHGRVAIPRPGSGARRRAVTL